MTKALTTIFNNHHSFLKSVSWRHLARDFRFSIWISIFGFESLFLGLGLCLCLGLCVKRSTSRERLTKTHEFRHHHRWCHQWWPSISILFLYSKFFFSSFGLVLCWFGSCSIYGLGLKGGLGMVICKFVGIFWFRVCLKMALIWWFC